jgi:hypothetical protein
MRRCSALAIIRSMSSTPWSASICSTIVNTRSRTSGSFMGGSGSEMSSIDDGDLHPRLEHRVQRVHPLGVVDARSGWPRPGWAAP